MAPATYTFEELKLYLFKLADKMALFMYGMKNFAFIYLY